MGIVRTKTFHPILRGLRALRGERPWFFAAALAAISVTATAAVAPAQQVRSFLVTVTDDAHKPVTGLGAEDFAVKDGGARQPVMSAEPATGPLAVRIAVIRSAESSHEGFDGASTAAWEALHSANVDNSIESTSLIGPTVDGPLVADGVIHATVELGSTSADRRAVFVILDGSATGPGRGLLEHLRAAKASLWVIDLVSRNPTDPELDRAITSSGGLHISVTDRAGLAAAARDVAALLTTAQYVVTATVAVTATGSLPLATRHDRGIVLTPFWSR